MVVVAEPVYKTVAFVTSPRVKDAICEREREPIRDRCSIELAVVDADSDFPVFLRGNYNWA